MNWVPECETLHCADGRMRQTFRNGATITVDWKRRTVTVADRKGDVAYFEGTAVKTLDDFHELQAWAESM